MMQLVEAERIGVEAMSEEQRQALVDWGLRMFGMGRQVIADIRDIRYEARLIVLDDGSRWKVHPEDVATAELWSLRDKVLVADGEMYRLEVSQRIIVDADDDGRIFAPPASLDQCGVFPRDGADEEEVDEASVAGELLRRAEAFDYGFDEEQEDRERAIELYMEAAAHGAPEAYLRLADLTAEALDPARGVDWLRLGAKKGISACWAALARVYMGANFSFDVRPDPDRCREAWRKFFSGVDPLTFDPSGDRLFGLLKEYVSFMRRRAVDPTDWEVVASFRARFSQSLLQVHGESGSAGRLRELDEVVRLVTRMGGRL